MRQRGHRAPFVYRSLSLADGTYQLQSRSTDLAGHTSPTSAALELQIDRQAPAKPGPADLLTSSDTGTDHQDDITAIFDPRFSGLAEAHSRIVVEARLAGEPLPGSIVAQAVVLDDDSDGVADDGRGVWQATSSKLGPGHYDIVVRSIDAAGNVSLLSDPLPIVIDPRALGFTNLANSRDVNADGEVTPVDALLVINQLNSQGITIVAEGEEGAPFMDVNGDMSITPVDVLMVINELNGQPSLRAEPAAEGESKMTDWLVEALTGDDEFWDFLETR